MLYDFTNNWNLKKNKQNRNESQVQRTKTVLLEGTGGRRRNEKGEVNHRYILPVPKQMSHRDEMYSMGNAVKDNAASLYGDRW